MTLPEAVAFGRAVEPYRPMILEDPVPPDNVDTMAEVASKIGVPIATGERAIDLRECEVLMLAMSASISVPMCALWAASLPARRLLHWQKHMMF